MKKTAVEWLVKNVNSDCLNSTFIRPELVTLALEMELNQSNESYHLGYCNGYNEAAYDSQWLETKEKQEKNNKK